MLDANGKVIATTSIATNGSYNFADIIGDAAYTVQVSIHQGMLGNDAPVTALPNLWGNTGEQLGTVPNVNLDNNMGGNMVDGKKTITVGGTNVSDVNFGINKFSNADIRSYTFTSTPASNTIVALNGTNNAYGAVPGLLSGNDREDGVLGGATSRFVITALPTNGVLLYDGVPVTTATLITAGNQPNAGSIFTNPALLSIQFTGSGYTSTVFSYAFVDEAKFVGTSNTYTINMTSGPVPVDLLGFSTVVKNCETELNWTIGDAINFDRFEVEYSVDGRTYQYLATVPVNGKAYQFKHKQSEQEAYYRLKMIDFDAQFKHSSALKVISDCNASAIVVYPNPAHDQINIKGAAQNASINVYNALGQKVLFTSTNNQEVYTLNVAHLPSGVYTIEILDNTSKKTFQFSKKN